jgi:phosphoribosylglycinamide formyltransferase-1
MGLSTLIRKPGDVLSGGPGSAKPCRPEFDGPNCLMLRLGILGSGSGSNMQAILDAIRAGTLQAEIALVLSDNPGAFILQRAADAGISTGLIDCRGFRTKFPDEAQEEAAGALRAAGVRMVCLAGFMRMVRRPLLAAFPERILNIHPALLPKYPGLHAWEQALEDGATESGCTVHYVDEGMDTGPVILQAKVPVRPDDTPASLHARIQVEEHRLYPEAVSIAASRL